MDAQPVIETVHPARIPFPRAVNDALVNSVDTSLNGVYAGTTGRASRASQIPSDAFNWNLSGRPSDVFEDSNLNGIGHEAATDDALTPAETSHSFPLSQKSSKEWPIHPSF